MNELETRVAKLERTNRRLCLALFAVSLLTVGVAAVAPELQKAKFSTVRAEAFIIEDESGNIRGILGFRDEQNENGLALIGRDGKRGTVITPGESSIRVTKPDRSIEFIR